MKPKRLKVATQFRECPACKGVHASWWFTSSTPPPACHERRIRSGRSS